MAPNPVTEGSSKKRTSSDAGFNTPDSTKQLKRYHHHHKLSWRQKVDGVQGQAFHDHEVFDQQLRRSTSLILGAVGFDSASEQAIQSLSDLASEYIYHLLSDVRLSMLSSRRVQPIPHDFLSALNASNLTLSALLPHLEPPVDPAKTQATISIEPQEGEETAKQLALVEKMLVDTAPQKAYIHAGLPPLPSRHTYKAEPVYAQREDDPKQVRERATEEGRLGEEALRRLVSSRSRAVNNLEAAKASKKMPSTKQRMRDLWKETMTAALNEGTLANDTNDASYTNKAASNATPSSSEFDEYSIRVNADSIYWRKPATTSQSVKATDS